MNYNNLSATEFASLDADEWVGLSLVTSQRGELVIDESSGERTEGQTVLGIDVPLGGDPQQENESVFPTIMGTELSAGNDSPAIQGIRTIRETKTTGYNIDKSPIYSTVISELPRDNFGRSVTYSSGK